MASVTPEQLVERARFYLGTPYYHCGRSIHGVDCAGLLLVVAHDLGITTTDWKDYSTQVQSDWFEANIRLFCDRLPTKGDIRPGDVLWFAIGRQPHHVGMATDKGVIHAHQSVGRVVEHCIDDQWRRRLRGVYRWRGLTNG